MRMKATMKTVVAAMVAAATALAAAASGGAAANGDGAAAARPKRTLAPGEFEARARRSFERRTGGKVRKPGSAQGKVVFLNAQRRVPAEALAGAFAEIDATVHPMWEAVDVEGVNAANPKGDIARVGGRIGVAIVDDGAAPGLVVAPEDGWAVVNVAALAAGGAEGGTLAARVRKEVLRGFALAGGCAFMSRGQVVLRGGVRGPRGLDAIAEEEYGVEALMTLERELPGYGVMPWREATYKQACREGWAPKPTNDVQRAIWDKVNADKERGPSNPILIKPEPKK